MRNIHVNINNDINQKLTKKTSNGKALIEERIIHIYLKKFFVYHRNYSIFVRKKKQKIKIYF
jgi:hypothetical protein